MTLLTPKDIREHTFQIVRFKGGYDVDEVDEFLDQVTETIEALGQQAVQGLGASTQSLGRDVAGLNTKIAELTSKVESLTKENEALRDASKKQGESNEAASQLEATA
ncbi:dihydrouridine synthase, partial [Bifidobacteriaceae bacterium NR020]